MMSITELIRAASAEGFTQEQARALIDAQVEEMVTTLGDLTPEEARRRVLANVGYYTGYLEHDHADRIMQLFDTEHPIFGRSHPTPEEALRIGMEWGRHSRKMETQK